MDDFRFQISISEKKRKSHSLRHIPGSTTISLSSCLSPNQIINTSKIYARINSHYTCVSSYGSP